jgi:hypothetical protein
VLGVNLYGVVLELFNDGDHDPKIPFVEVVGKAFNVPPEQIAFTWLNIGIVGLFTITV